MLFSSWLPQEAFFHKGAAMENGVHEDSATEKDDDGLAGDKWLEIHVKNPNQANPSMEFTWCLSKRLIELIKQQGIRYPFLFIIVARETRDEYGEILLHETDRLLIPLEQGGDRIEFHEPGPHRLFATIVWSAFDDFDVIHHRKTLSEHLRIKKAKANIEQGIRWEIVDDKEVFLSNVERAYPTMLFAGVAEVLTIVVANDYFAKEPPDWLAWWANLWYEYKPKNRCLLRRRYPVVFLIQPPVVAIWILMRAIIGLTIALELFLIGWRHISLWPVLRPFQTVLQQVNSRWPEERLIDPEGYFSTTNSVGQRRPIWQIPLLSPLMWFFAFCGSSYLIRTFGLSMITAISFIAIHIMGIIFVWLIWVFVLKTIEHFTDQQDETAHKRKLAKRARQQKNDEKYAKYRALLLESLLSETSGAKMDGSLKSLPKERQTVYIRYLGLKGDLCKPFRRR